MADESEAVTKEFDRRIGENVYRVREARGMTQSELARRLAARGHATWRSQTIVKVEKGQRRLGLQEADDIADILDVEIDLLVRPQASDTATRLLGFVTELNGAIDRLRAAVVDVVRSKRHIRGVLQMIETSDGTDLVLNEAATVLRLDPIQVAADAVADAEDDAVRVPRGGVQSVKFLGSSTLEA